MSIDVDVWSGPALRELRLQAEISINQVARHYGAVRQQIQNIERAAVVQPATALKYLRALQRAGEEELQT